MGAAAARSRERVEVGGLLFSSVCVVREPVSFFSLSRALHQLFLSTTQHFFVGAASTSAWHHASQDIPAVGY